MTKAVLINAGRLDFDGKLDFSRLDEACGAAVTRHDDHTPSPEAIAAYAVGHATLVTGAPHASCRREKSSLPSKSRRPAFTTTALVMTCLASVVRGRANRRANILTSEADNPREARTRLFPGWARRPDA